MPSVGTGAGQIFSDIGLYKGVVIAIKHIKKDHIQVTRQVLLEFNEVGASFRLFIMPDIARESTDLGTDSERYRSTQIGIGSERSVTAR